MKSVPRHATFMLAAMVAALSPSMLQAQQASICNSEGRTCVTATRITNASAPSIDGNLSDPVWQNAGKLNFPNASGGKFTINTQKYDQTDPSSYTLSFLHDDVNLYIAIDTNDAMVESADVYENSDGLSGMALARKDGNTSFSQLTWFQEARPNCSSVRVGPALDRGRISSDGEWRCKLRGTWNNDSDHDTGYSCEISIPLNDPPGPPGGPQGLGGWSAGDRLGANFVIMDHDSNPGGCYNGGNTNFAQRG